MAGAVDDRPVKIGPTVGRWPASSGKNKRDRQINVDIEKFHGIVGRTMRIRRMKITGRVAVYHCMTRTVNREMLFDDRAKEMLRRMIWQVADFSGVEVLSYCVMSNHFHVLVRVPDGGEVAVSDRELLRRYRVLYPKPTGYAQMRMEVLEELLRKGGEDAEQVRTRLLARMHDISQYMKTLKQRFTIWYNRAHGRIGTLWSERFKSVIVEGEVAALQIVAGYIDLNPVRAGIVRDPKDYRWSSYGEAVAGSKQAQEGLIAAVDGKTFRRTRSNWEQAQREYRMYLYCKGVTEAPGKGGGAASLTEKDWQREMQRGGQIPVAQALRCRVRYFTDGAVIGSKEFVSEVFKTHRHFFGKRRSTGPRTMKGSDWDGMCVVRDLRREVFG